MERALKTFTIILTLLLGGCGYLDVGGLVYVETGVNERFQQSMDWNSLHPERKVQIYGDSYTFLIGSDTHIGPTENTVLFLNKANNYDFSIILGDITTGNKSDFEKANEVFTTIPQKPCFLIAGNHDFYFDGWQYYLEFFGSSTYTVEVETTTSKDLLIFLETGSATLGKEQMKWLKNLLEKERTNYRNCFVFSHVNIRKSGLDLATSMINEDSNILLDLYFQHNVDYVFQGHRHQKAVDVIGNTTYLTLDALVEESNKPSTYVKFTNTNGECSYEFIDLK